MLLTSSEFTEVRAPIGPGFSVGYKYSSPSGSAFEIVDVGDLADIYGQHLEQSGLFYVVRDQAGREQRVSEWTIQQGAEVRQA